MDVVQIAGKRIYWKMFIASIENVRLVKGEALDKTLKRAGKKKIDVILRFHSNVNYPL